jgi:hypothetical protein
MVVYNLGEKDIRSVRVILASFGIFAANMRDIDAVVSRTRRDILDKLGTGNLTMGKQNTRPQHTAQSGYI